MKKIIALVLTAILLLGTLAACSGSSSSAAKSFTIAVPNDTTNEARALKLLEANGLIKLKDGSGETATKLDIAENPYNITIEEIEAAQLPSMLKDVDYAVINSNYAAGAGLNPGKDALIREGAESPYANILAVKEGNESLDKIKALVTVLRSDEIKKFIEDTYDGAVVFFEN